MHKHIPLPVGVSSPQMEGSVTTKVFAKLSGETFCHEINFAIEILETKNKTTKTQSIRREMFNRN